MWGEHIHCDWAGRWFLLPQQDNPSLPLRGRELFGLWSHSLFVLYSVLAGKEEGGEKKPQQHQNAEKPFCRKTNSGSTAAETLQTLLFFSHSYIGSRQPLRPPSPQITLSQTLTCNFVAFGRPEERAYLTSRLCKPLLGPDPGYWARLEVPEYLIGSAGEITKMRPNEKSFGREKNIYISASFWLWSFSPRHSTNHGSPNGW